MTGWAWTARVLRAQTLALRSRDFVAAAAALGERPGRIVLCEILPNMVPLAVSCFIGAVLYAIAALVGLEFLGIGDVERVTWGTILYWARSDAALLTGSWWTFVPAGLCVGLVGFALALVNSALDELGNPRLRLERAFLRAVAAPPGADAPTPVVAEGGWRKVRCSRSTTCRSTTCSIRGACAQSTASRSGWRLARSSAWWASRAAASRPWRRPCCGCCCRRP